MFQLRPRHDFGDENVTVASETRLNSLNASRPRNVFDRERIIKINFARSFSRRQRVFGGYDCTLRLEWVSRKVFLNRQTAKNESSLVSLNVLEFWALV